MKWLMQRETVSWTASLDQKLRREEARRCVFRNAKEGADDEKPATEN